MPDKATILIIDDSATSRRGLAMMLESAHYMVVQATSGEEALALLSHMTPDVILLDVVMPDLNGFDVCRRLKADSRWQHIPIILLTALSSALDIVHGLEAGADEFLLKPVDGQVLRARVRSMLRIKRQYDQLKATLELREDMAHMIAHDMRSPLATAALYTYLLLHKNPREEQIPYLRAVQSQLQRVHRFINDMLLLAKTEGNQLRLNLTPMNVCQLVQAAYLRHTPAAQVMGIQLESDFAVELAEDEIAVDASLFERVLDNLLDNALKYTPAGGSVWLTCARLSDATGRRVRIGIADAGPGIAPADRQRIFEKYEIVDLRRRGVQHTGLGLAFCKMVVEAHGGRLYVTDHAPQGAEFVIEV